ncbi:EscU/YscU/HrcU family type III secretion system export apparatus switch protein [Candidatus Latescibacterota bacterium]
MNRVPRTRRSSRRYAAALRYHQEDDPAPRLVAKGAGTVAEKIIAAAKEEGVTIYEDPDLVALLMTLDINDFIPPGLYLAVAEVLAFIYRMNGAVSPKSRK